jgi:hypothetical protein
MAREIAEPTDVLTEIAQQTVRPRLAALSEIIREIVGADVSQQVVLNCARSVVGQILFYHFARPMLVRVFPNEPFDASKLDELSAHITAFSLQGLRGIAPAAAAAARAKRKATKGARR